MTYCQDCLPLKPDAWHAWFSVQAEWTRAAREWLFRQAGIDAGGSVLEVGCGTGAIAGELARPGSVRVVGLDVDGAMLAFARCQAGDVVLLQGDAHTLPFADGVFDSVICHYLLLWLADPAWGVREMARLARPGGCVIACAEPDYGGRIDHPPELAVLGRLQAEGLRRQGADPQVGRRLGELFVAAGLQVTMGVMAGQWALPGASGGEFEAEWRMRKRDLAGRLSADELDRLRSVDRRALESGRRVLYVPTFYALGRKSSSR